MVSKLSSGDESAKSEGSITQCLRKLEAGDEDAARMIWDRYFDRLIRVARTRLGTSLRRVEDEEDVVLDALFSFFDFARKRRFPRLRDRHGLWPLLVTITERKAINQRSRHLALRRGGGDVRGDSVFENDVDGCHAGGIDEYCIAPAEATVEKLSEECRQLLDILDCGTLRRIAVLKLQQYKNVEIAEKLGGRSVRSVERKLERIRAAWSAAGLGVRARWP